MWYRTHLKPSLELASVITLWETLSPYAPAPSSAFLVDLADNLYMSAMKIPRPLHIMTMYREVDMPWSGLLL